VAELIEPLGRAFKDGVATHTAIYQTRAAPGSRPSRDPDRAGRTVAVLDVDYPVDVYLRRLAELRNTVLGASLAGALGALIVACSCPARDRAISALTGGVAGGGRRPLAVAAGALERRDRRLTRAFNEMLEGLRQRDFIRDTFGRYVSPEVARTLLESPEGLRLGGEKREVTILMSDLRATRTSPSGQPRGRHGGAQRLSRQMADSSSPTAAPSTSSSRRHSCRLRGADCPP